MTRQNASPAAVPAADDDRAPEPPRRRGKWRASRDWGGILARLLCVGFALIGLVPLAVGGLVRIDRVQAWVATETAALLERELGVEARYELELVPWPLEIAFENLEVPANDGGSAFLTARSVVARPRIFSLLAGKLDFGEVEIEEPVVRAVVRRGALVNLDYHLPESSGEGGDDIPVSALALTNGALDLSVDDSRVRSQELDVDVAIGPMPSDRESLVPGGSFEVSVRAGGTAVDHVQPDPASPEHEQVNEDAVCRLELRAQISDAIVIRRLALDGSLDFDPARGSRPACDVPDADWRKLAVLVEGLHVQLASGRDGLDRVDGRVKARLPAAVVHRLVDFPPTTGWVEIDLDDIHLDSSVTIPNVRGKIRGAELGVDSKFVARQVSAELTSERDVLDVAKLAVSWSGGEAEIGSVRIRPLEEGVPLEAKEIAFDAINLEDMLDDLAAHPRAHVAWAIDRAYLPHFAGTLDPPRLEGPLTANTRDFAVFDQPHLAKVKTKMMGVNQGTITGTFKVEPYGIVLSRMNVDTGRSRVLTTVALHFEEVLGLTVHEGSFVDLADVSPIVDIPMKGVAHMAVAGQSTFDDPRFAGTLRVDGFDFAGFPIGDVLQSKVAFELIQIQLTEARLRKNKSLVDVPQLSIDFDDGDAAVVLEGQVDSTASGLQVRDFFEIMGLVSDEPPRQGTLPLIDPQWREIDALARGRAHIHYVLGGKRDRCASGNLDVRATMAVDAVELWGLSFDGGSLDADYHWEDIAAGDHGLTVRLHSGVLRKGTGTVVASASIDPGARLRADVVGSAIPLEEFAAFRRAFQLDADGEEGALQRVRPEANVSFVATLGGTLSRLRGQAELDISPMRIGPDILPSSRLFLSVVPDIAPETRVATTRCNNAVSKAFDPHEWAADRQSGFLVLAGQLFRGQVEFTDLQITQQRNQLVSGDLSLDELDLGAFANLLPGIAFSESPPRGRLTAKIVVDELPVNEPGLAEVRVFVEELSGERAGDEVHIGAVAEPLVLSGDALRIPTMSVETRLASGLKGTFSAAGKVEHLSQPNPTVAIGLTLDPVDLSKLGLELPQIDRADGTVRASMQINGALDAPKLSGRVDLRDGMLRVKGFPLPLDDIHVDVRIDETEARIHRATARAGNTGQISMSGRMPLHNLAVTGGDATVIATDVKIPVADGVKLTADARLHATYEPNKKGQRALPNVTGRITLKQLAYTRAMNFQPTVGAAVVDQITSGRRRVDAYNPKDDWVSFDVSVVSPEPVRIANNLLDMRLEVKQPGVQVSGTNQRFGARGTLAIMPGSKLFLQRHQFNVRDGTIGFDNPTQIAPSLDVHATTEYRRYQSSADTQTTAAAASASTASTGGRWRIAMHAYGELDAPEVRFTSDPPLSQEDIVLLLQVGQTRAELERGLLTGIGQAVGLEALSAVTGLDKAFKDVPIIDEFRVGSQYSSRTGRPEPTVTFGKRLTDQVRATLTTGLSENREVRSNVEWQLKGGVSLQGSYDNVNEVSSSSIGNIGGGIRWRLEFE